MTVDLLLAIAHHLIVFSLTGLLFAQLVLVRPGLGAATLKRLAGLDRAYGSLALAIVLVGVGRIFFGLKGWEYYVGNHAFWGKMAAFVIVGLLSVPPTMRIIRWNKEAAAAETYIVPDAEVAAARRYIHFELLFLFILLVFAAMMARGIG